MDHKRKIHEHLKACSLEILDFIKTSESEFPEGWVPIAYVKNSLDLNLVAVPQGGTQHGPKGWLFATLARMLEDAKLVEYRRQGSRSFCRSVRAA